jgi:SAM-dependent methyltransferase
MKECSKSISRRLSNPNFMRRYFKGRGLDIGGKPDPLALYAELFPLVTQIKTWDIEDGDAQYLAPIPREAFNFVHSSHCLEHLNDPIEGLKNWVRVLSPGGYLIVTVPDEDLYEQGVFPSTFNKDHKWTFTIYKRSSWSPNSLNILDLVIGLPDVSIEKIELLNATHRTLPRYDQTLTPVGECGIEIVLRKEMKGRHKCRFISEETTAHLNQYMDDHKVLCEFSKEVTPFEKKEWVGKGGA